MYLVVYTECCGSVSSLDSSPQYMSRHFSVSFKLHFIVYINFLLLFFLFLFEVFSFQEICQVAIEFHLDVCINFIAGQI